MNTLKLLWNSFKNDFFIFSEFIKRNIEEISNIIMISLLGVNVFLNENSINKWYGLIMEIVFLLLIILRRSMNILKVSNTNFPVKEKRLTKKGFDGQIYIEPSDLKLAIVYLKEIEDYAERNGFL